MKYSEFEDIISQQRMRKYLLACNNESKRAMTLYRYNLKLSQEMFALISCFEVTLRNRIDKEMNVVEMVRNIFPAKTKDFVTAVDEHCIILVKELRDKETMEEVEKIAKTISDTLSAETGTKVFISIGTATFR